MSLMLYALLQEFKPYCSRIALKKGLAARLTIVAKKVDLIEKHASPHLTCPLTG